MLLFHGFREEVLMKPIEAGADCLKIVTGYTAHAMASWHMEEIQERYSDKLTGPIQIVLLVGMCNDGVSLSLHNGLKQLMRESSASESARLTAQYIYQGAPVHSKLYLWEKAGSPLCAYMGSANYSQTAFSNRRREIMTKCDPKEAQRYFESIESDSIYCNHAEVSKYIRFLKDFPVFSSRRKSTGNLSEPALQPALPSVTLSFLTNDGKVAKTSGINWGQRTGRNPNEAYIRLPADKAKSGFFPLGKQHFSVVTDDQKQLILRVEQAGDKAITTPASNALLGEYFRNRLGLANGAFVTKADFDRYGRSDVTFYKLDDEQFYMDFSV